MKWKQYMLIALLVGTTGIAKGEANPYGVVTPPDWEYQALMTLVKHGAITDTQGLELGNRSFTRQELIPLMADVVKRRETMNESDRMLALRLYNENRRSIMNYEIAQEEQKKGIEEEDSIYLAKDMNLLPAERALTDEEIQKKMENFQIDDRAIQMRGDVRIRTSNRGNDMRSRLEMTIPISHKGKGDIPQFGDIDAEVLEAMQDTQWKGSVKEQKVTLKEARQAWSLQQKEERKQDRLEKAEAKKVEKEGKKAEKVLVQEEKKARKALEKERKTREQLEKKEKKRQEKVLREQAKLEKKK